LLVDNLVKLIIIYTFELDGGGATCIGWDGKMFRVGGGLIPDDDEFSVETNTYIH